MRTLDRTILFMNKYGVSPQKRFSQNFLIDERAISKIVSVLVKGEEVVEIGPGLGSVTFPLLERAGKLTAIDFDRDMVKVLESEIVLDKFQLIQADFLKCDLKAMFKNKITYIGNLPYQITRDLLKKILVEANFDKFGFMVQKEVADDFLNVKKGYQNMFSLLFDLFGSVERMLDLHPGAFYPPPKVNSSFLVLTNSNDFKISENQFEFLKACYKNSNKTLLNNLKNSSYSTYIDKLKEIIDLSYRPHQLNKEQYIKLLELIG